MGCCFTSFVRMIWVYTNQLRNPFILFVKMAMWKFDAFLISTFPLFFHLISTL